MDIKEQLENLKDDLVNKNEEILHLNWKLGLQDNSTAARIKELQEENARLKVSEEDPLLHPVGLGIAVASEGPAVVGSRAPGPPQTHGTSLLKPEGLRAGRALPAGWPRQL